MLKGVKRATPIDESDQSIISVNLSCREKILAGAFATGWDLADCEGAGSASSADSRRYFCVRHLIRFELIAKRVPEARMISNR
jgi:hypothetical protein